MNEELKQLIAENPFDSRHLTKDQRRDAVAMLLLGYRPVDIAEKLGLQRHHVYYYLRPIAKAKGLFADELIAYATDKLLTEYIAEVR